MLHKKLKVYHGIEVILIVSNYQIFIEKDFLFK